MTSYFPLADHRCSCGRLLFKAMIRTAWIEVKCRRCGGLIHFSPPYVRSKGLSVVSDREGGARVFQDHISEEILRPHAAWVRVDGLWRILHTSEGFSSLVLNTQKELEGMKVFELFTPECAVAIGNRLIEATGTHVPFVIECVMLKACSLRTFRMHGVPQEGEEGYVVVFEGWEEVAG